MADKCLMMVRLKADAEEEKALRPVRERGDRVMVGVCWLLWAASVGFAFLYDEWVVCLVAGTALAVLATALWKLASGTLGTRIGLAVIFMLFSALLIDEAHGLIETHFSIFALLAFLLYYRDWRPVCAAAGTIAAHHYAFCQMQMGGLPVYVFPGGHSCDMVWVHAAYVVLETAVLVYLGAAIRREALETAALAAFSARLIETGVIDLRSGSLGEVRSAALDGMLVAINGAVVQAGEAAGGMSGMSGDVTAAAREILVAGRQQQTGSESAARLVRQMAEAAEDVARHCTQVSTVARGAAVVVEGGRATMRKTAQTIDSLVATVVHVSAEVNALLMDSQRIEEIIAIMEDIARQTDLLALNATIEAARAGDAGKTFHVVAQEIRQLSLRTHTSLEQAQERVSDVREKTDRVRAMADRCAAEAREGGLQVDEANASLEKVVTQLPEIARRAEAVVDQARQYTGLSEDAAAEMQGIERMIVENTSNLKRIDTLGQSLQRMSLALVGSVRAFRTREI